MLLIGIILAYFMAIQVPSAPAQATNTPPEKAKSTATLKIHVTGERNAKGKILVWLFDHAKGFPTDSTSTLRQQSVAIDAATMTADVSFNDLPPGTYAVAVLHDENNNGKMDKTFVGFPKEGYGSSNNPPKEMRAAYFDEAKFSLNSPGQTMEIKLIYW
jgi:uncharacterized protein (DUF2141 family)